MTLAQRNYHRYMAFGISLAIAIAAAVVLPAGLGFVTRLVAGYDAGILFLIGFFWLRTMHADGPTTKARAALEDPGRNFVLCIVFVVVLVGLSSAITLIGIGQHTHTVLEKWVSYGLGLIAVTAGWFMLHTVYTFRYAHLFWYDLNDDGKPGGMTFPETEEPSDWDFAYLSFCIGASFAVSDPQITATAIRREVMWHSIISFGYNSIIIGLVINLFAGIFGALGSSGH
jgi:uncharacterized membrane protein